MSAVKSPRSGFMRVSFVKTSRHIQGTLGPRSITGRCETKSEDDFGEPRSLASGPAEVFPYLRRGLRGDRARGTLRLGLDKSSPDGGSGELYPDGSQHGPEFCCSGTWPDCARL